ncbi:hypothetical protein P280DRAFT_408140 [Massarina eburnea CBS 473.64]|uniref:SH3 domain-containing protein n=1 Tax=Massarina eburnea CBS 473.64 TaxID=1395130 RepID=A0A6A6RSM7_9PLEO|nr:hypothetical protein P280DRAFT_408140 [Massarina eburnea CBS 473.64]
MAIPFDSPHRPRRVSRRKHHHLSTTVFAVSLLAALPATMAQSCISLQGSSTCPSFTNASISTGLSGDFSFLSFVSDVGSFDSRLQDYIGTAYVKTKYQDIIGCSSVNLTNTTSTYARYTTTFLCNAIVQASVSPCSLSDEASKPLCADSCAEFALSEQQIASTPALCGTPGSNANEQIRSDLARCQLPSRVLNSNQCIEGYQNEPSECGYGSNLAGLCSFCATSSPNSTDSCCVNANVGARCVGVQLPTTSSMPPLFTTTTTTTASAAAANGHGLSSGAIAGIVIGSLVGAALLLGAIIMGCIFFRRHRQNQQGSILNTPSPTRQAVSQPPMAYGGDGYSPPPVLPGARVARMSALEGSTSSNHSSPAAGVGAYRRQHDYDSPESRRMHLGGDLPKRQGSLSSHSALGFGARSGQSSPTSTSDPDRNFSSPDGVASGQSEQLQFFKDYYSQDDIHPNDTVSTLWAYQPRANDELELERGDMLKVVGIWDDGWATGLKLSETAEEWEARRAVQRDSGVSNGSRQSQIESDSDIKAFPLVCVCLPQHWRKTIEGDSTDTGGGSGGPPPSP